MRHLTLVLICIVTGLLAYHSTGHAQSISRLIYTPGFPSELTFQPELGSYTPDPVKIKMTYWNFTTTPILNIRAHIAIDTSVLQLAPGDSTTRFITSLFPDSSIEVTWDLHCMLTEPVSDSTYIPFYTTAYDPATEQHPDTSNTHRMKILLLPEQKPDIKTMSISMPRLQVTGCSGVGTPTIPVEFSMRNNWKHDVYVDHLRLKLPTGWQLPDGQSDIVPVEKVIPRYESLVHTWEVNVPDEPNPKKGFKVEVWYGPVAMQSTYATIDIADAEPQLHLTPALPKIHLSFDTATGTYPSLPLPIDATIMAWMGDFESYSVKAELIYGAWLFLELDESQPGMQAVKHISALAMCDSVELHWQATMIKPNEYGSAYEGAIKYTVYNADSSDFREYVQTLVIDAVNQTGLPRPPAAQDMQLSAYPNPFAGSTTLYYTLSGTDFASLMVFDMMGRQVATLFEGIAEPGMHKVAFNVAGLTPGVYMATLSSGNSTKTIHILHF